jgi:transposase
VEIPKPRLPYGEPWRLLVTHDESTFNANDDNPYSWKKKGTQKLKSKSRGKGLMVSEFLCAAGGRLSNYNKETAVRDYATEIFKYGSGKSDEGWWDSKKMLKQVLEKAIPIFEKQYPGHIAVFAFDNSSGHACKADNALVANRMNLGPGGKQPKMHNTILPQIQADDIEHVQCMVYMHGDKIWETDTLIPESLVGQPKGLKRVLQERGLWIDGLKKQCGTTKTKEDIETESQSAAYTELDRCKRGKHCCALRIMENQPDFLAEKSLLEIEITNRGHECIFYPKFHCELNYIEYFWGAVKRYTRENCNYSFAELETTVLAALDSVSLRTIQRFANRSRRWIDSYINGLNERQKEFVERQESSHRHNMGEGLV